MSESAAGVIAKQRQGKEHPIIYGETLAAALGICGVDLAKSEFTHAASHVLAPPLRPKESTPKYLMEQIAQ